MNCCTVYFYFVDLCLIVVNIKMNAAFIKTGKGINAYIQKSVRVDGKSTTFTVKKLGLLEDIQREHGCADPRQWVTDLAHKMTQEEKEGKQCISIDFYPGKEINPDETPLRHGGDIFLLSNYYKLGLPKWCDQIMANERSKFDLGAILRTLVVSRVLFPCSKSHTLVEAKEMIEVPEFTESQIYKALSLMSFHIDDIQALVWKNSQKIMERNTRVIFYDCTNYYFEIEDNDKDYVDTETGEVVIGLRKRGKSKEHRPNPIVQMGLLMDGDGIPLSFIIFPGNESEQPSLKRIEEMVADKFGLNEFVISTDAGLGSEDNRRYNMTEGREYITVQSLPSLPKKDQDMALDPRGWRVAFRERGLPPVDPEDPEKDVFDLNEIDLERERHTRFYKEIIVDKTIKGQKPTTRPERVIVTYSHDFALYLQAKRAERLAVANKIVRNKQTKSRQSQQDPRNYVETVYVTKDGTKATKVLMAIDKEAIEKEKRFDGFYAYGTSLDDDAVDVLRARSFHHEIEHLFRTTKTHLEARPVYLRREDRIRSHFLVCFLAMVVLNMLHKQITATYPEVYKDNPLSIDCLIATLRKFKYGMLKGKNYQPMYKPDPITLQLLEMFGLQLNREIITNAKMRTAYKKVKKD